MPVLEFALDPYAQHRVQVHLSTGQSSPATILLNRSILGSLGSEEQLAGKAFLLPDNSFLNVRFVNGQPEVSRAGYLLPPIDAAIADAADSSPAAVALERNKKLGGCLVTWLIVNLVVIGFFILFDFLAISTALARGTSPLIFLLFGLLRVVGLIGLSLIFYWKKSGFYLAAAFVVLSILLSIPFGLLQFRLFLPLVTITILYVYLNRSGIWEKMR